MKHRFDPTTDWCMSCGCSLKDYIDGYRPVCDVFGNVTGVSHIIARCKLDKLVDVVIGSSGGTDEQSCPA